MSEHWPDASYFIISRSGTLFLLNLSHLRLGGGLCYIGLKTKAVHHTH